MCPTMPQFAAEILLCHPHYGPRLSCCFICPLIRLRIASGYLEGAAAACECECFSYYFILLTIHVPDNLLDEG